MINKPFEEITKEDIESLISNEVAESKTLEYKEELPGSSDGDKKEFLYDISAFANASGGDILYGIAEKRDDNKKPTGIPESVSGLSGINIDAEIRRLQSCIQDGVAPRIPGIQLRPIDGFTEPVIIIRIPKSWNPPHMVTLKQVDRFYSRNNAGKYRLDIDEIRASFIASESLSRKIKEFRINRIAQILADETPIALEGGPKIILHILPIESFLLGKSFDISIALRNHIDLRTLSAFNVRYRYNFDGVLKYSFISEDISTSYVQLFRSGIIEAVDTYMLSYENEQKAFHIIDIEKELIGILNDYLRFLRSLGVNPPLLIALSILGVRGFAMVAPRFRLGLARHPIDRDNLLIPETLVKDYEEEASTVLWPIFDTLWQSAGWQKSPCYDEQGNRVDFR